jgi:hypothetical protein
MFLFPISAASQYIGIVVTIKLTSALEKHLVLEIVAGLHDTIPQYGFVFAHDFKWADELMKELPEDVKAKIDRFIGERGLSQFIAGEIDNELDRTTGVPDIDKTLPITQLPFLQNTLKYSRNLVEKLKHIPNRYILTVPLPEQFSEPLLNKVDEKTNLGPDISIIRGNLLEGHLPVTSEFIGVDVTLFRDYAEKRTQVQREWSDDRMYFSLPILGYENASASSSLSRQLEDNLRAFYGAATAIGMLSYSWRPDAAKDAFVTGHSSGDNELRFTSRLEGELVRHNDRVSTLEYAKAHTDNLKADFNKRINLIATIFQKNIDCAKLFSACIWYYRAYTNDRPLDALLQATIAIETMLGDQKAAEGVGLTNLLASRCAFLLGRSSSHRAKIADEFKKIYALRSAIVHEGRHLQKVGDREVLKLATDLCGSIILRELYIRREQELKS